MTWAPTLFGFFGGQAAVDGIENSELRLLDRRDRIVDGKSGLPLQPVGAACCTLDIAFVLVVRDVGLQVVHVVGDLRLHSAPVSGRRVVRRFDFLIYLFDCFGRRGVRLFLARRDLVVRFLLGRVQCLFGTLGADRQVRELLREFWPCVLLLP